MSSPVMKVEGLTEVEANLAMLGSKVGTRILRRSMLNGADPILEKAKANVAAIERGSGALHKSMGKRFLVGRQKHATNALPAMGGNFRVQILPFSVSRVAIALYNMFYDRRAKRLSYAHLLEFGFTHKGGKRIRKQAFMGPALDSQSGNAVSIFARDMKDGIAKALKPLARKSRKAT
jgi:hypothetical protein